jgi:hypothetical protein
MDVEDFLKLSDQILERSLERSEAAARRAAKCPRVRRSKRKCIHSVYESAPPTGPLDDAG